ncbi:MAG TPA: hypothetical protein VLX09_20205 [Stellaceae bacterium]|nr:hypothetical protein [Stellaceae bacterium]
MTPIDRTVSVFRVSGMLKPVLVAVTVAAIGAFAMPAYARWQDHGHDRDNHQGYHHDWDGGYYRSPPVVYSGPYGGYAYYPPPVVYGPGVGFSIQIH